MGFLHGVLGGVVDHALAGLSTAKATLTQSKTNG
jgi:hypothetical protein